MTNVGGPNKTRTRRLLADSCVHVLETDGWVVTKVSGYGNARIRRIAKGNQSKLAAIRTTQDQWIAFPRTRDDKRWATLSDVDLVVVASVDPGDPRFARVHIFDANELQRRFDRAYAARRAAGHSIPLGRGVWVSLYENEVAEPVSLVGAGIGVASPAVARVPLSADGAPVTPPPATQSASGDDGPLTIAEAKERLARALGVDPASIRITVEA